MKVLFIDDELNLIKLFKIMFDRNGHSADIVDNVFDAKIYLENNYDYIMIDYYMNGENTIDFLEFILQKYDAKSIYLLTGLEDEKVYKKLSKIGIVNFLKKPITYNEIIEKINEKK